MADEPALTDRIRRGLAHVPGVEEKRMFGSDAFLVDGTLRIAVSGDAAYAAMVRIGSAAVSAVDGPGVEPAIMRGKPMKGWVFLRNEAIVSDADVARWISVALAATPPARRSR